MGLGKSQIYSIALMICIIFTLLCSGFPFSAFQVLCADMPRGREGRHRAGVGRISEEPVQSLWACSSAALTAKGNDNIGVTLQKQQRSWMAIRSFLLYLNKLLWPNVTIPIQVFSFKEEVQVPITSSFLLTWLCLASSLLNQPLMIYHWLDPMRSPYDFIAVQHRNASCTPQVVSTLPVF